MPIKVGLSEKRRERLEKEFKRILPLIKKEGVEKIILFGSFAESCVHKASDMDLIIIKRTSRRFLERIEEFYKKIKPRCGLDLLVYTPEEFEKLKEESPFLKKAVKRGKIIYERRG